MTVRTDITINWFTSPRVITVLSPSADITIQDLLDTCRELEDDPANMVYSSLASAAGKENLGGGTLVGITMTLLNAVLAFEARPGPTYIQCRVSGGNLVAIDSSGEDISPIYPTAFTQVLTTASSSATLQEQTDIQYSSFAGAIHVNLASSYSGTTYPVGTPRQPVNNWEDALDISNERGIDDFHITGDALINSGLNYEGKVFRGESPTKTFLTISSGAQVTGCEFYEASISGNLDGETLISNCVIYEANHVDGIIRDCVLSGTITLTGTAGLQILQCSDGYAGEGTPTIDFNGAGSFANIRDYKGGIKFINKTGNEEVSIDGNLRLILDSTVTDGAILVRGIGKVVNQSTGTATVDATTLLSNDSVQAQSKYLIEALRPDHMGFGNIFYWNPVNGHDTNNSGLLPDNAKLTFAATQALCVANRGDVIFIVHDSVGDLIITETIDITVDSVSLRGPGNAVFVAISDSADSITISADNVQISGIAVTTAAGPTPRNAICVTGEFVRIENTGVVFSSGVGIKLDGGSNHILNRISIKNCLSSCLEITDTNTVTVTNALISGGSSWGIDLVKTGPGNHHLTNLDYVVITANAVGGIRIGSGVHLTTITERCHVGQSVTQPIRVQDNGTTTYDLLAAREQSLTNKVWDEPSASHVTLGSMGEAIAAAGLTPEQAKQLLLVFVNSL